MFRHLTTVFVGLLALFAAIDTRTDEELEMKVFNDDFGASRSVMCAMLKKANLEGRGYMKEVMNMQRKDPGSNKPSIQRTYFYYKAVKCSDKAIAEITQDLNTSIPDAVGNETTNKVRSEIQYRHLDSSGLCKVGLAVYFKDNMDCDVPDVQRSKRNGNQCQTSITVTISWPSSRRRSDRRRSSSSDRRRSSSRRSGWK